MCSPKEYFFIGNSRGSVACFILYHGWYRCGAILNSGIESERADKFDCSKPLIRKMRINNSEDTEVRHKIADGCRVTAYNFK
jgi:hypothetical protein